MTPHVHIDLTPESEAVKVVVSNDGWSDERSTEHEEQVDGC